MKDTTYKFLPNNDPNLVLLEYMIPDSENPGGDWEEYPIIGWQLIIDGDTGMAYCGEPISLYPQDCENVRYFTRNKLTGEIMGDVDGRTYKNTEEMVAHYVAEYQKNAEVSK